MNLDDAHIPVPKEFWSFETEKPMARCGLCGCDLTPADAHYLIEKAFQRGETIFEHAICLNCHAGCVNELSAESLERVQAYFLEHVDMDQRERALAEQGDCDYHKWISHCLIKKYPIAECEEYQLYGFCAGGDLILSGIPYALSGEAIEEIMELLSNETLGALSNLSDRLFGMDLPQNILLF